jgi:hypothetical protein
VDVSQKLNKYNGIPNPTPGSYEGVLDLTNDGFNPSTMTLESSKFWFYFSDDYDGYSEKLELTVEGDKWEDDAQVKNYTYSYGAGSVLVALQDDGKISFRVKADLGDFYFKGAKLEATGSANSVPDGGMTLAMLGLGLVGLGLARRRS